MDILWENMWDNPLGIIHTSSLDSMVRTSMFPSEELMAKIVPSGDRATKESLGGNSATCKSHKRMVVSKDPDARSDPSGENWTGLTLRAWPRNCLIRSPVLVSQTAHKVPVTTEPMAR